MGKVIIEKVPETKFIDGAKRWMDEKGEFVQISYVEDARHIAYFELKKGFSRGSHFHEHKEEVFYVIDGCIRGVFLDMDNMATEEYIFNKGDKVRVMPGCAHVFYGIEDCHAVEYSNQYYDKEDAHPYDFEKVLY